VSFRIRPYQKTDFDALWQMDQICFDPMLAYSRPELAIYMGRPGAFTLVAESVPGDPDKILKADKIMKEEIKIIGFIIAEARRRIGHIITIDVLPAARRSGIGSALLQAAEDRLRQAGAVVVELETAIDNAAAIQFYKRKEYFVEKTVPSYYSNHLDALVMSKDLVGVTANPSSKS
jgi:ribosomal-protein-alanine N-acetyltransferase